MWPALWLTHAVDCNSRLNKRRRRLSTGDTRECEEKNESNHERDGKKRRVLCLQHPLEPIRGILRISLTTKCPLWNSRFGVCRTVPDWYTKPGVDPSQ